jgi:electron transport complex protein RnfE
VREVLGSGSLLGIRLFGESFEPWTIMILPPGGFLTLGALLTLFAWIKQRRERTRSLETLEVRPTERAEIA